MNDMTGPGAPWGKANPRKGKAHLDSSLKFIARFPIGTTLSADEFDVWAHDEKLLAVPFGCPTTSDAWKVHVAKRQTRRCRINVSGVHPRLLHEGATPFVIDWQGRDLYEVNSPETSLLLVGAYPKFVQTLQSKRSQIARLYQGVDFNRLPPHHRAYAEQMYEDVDALADAFTSQIGLITQRFAKFKGRVERYLIEAGPKQIGTGDGDETDNTE
jgi:hypothetical protein